MSSRFNVGTPKLLGSRSPASPMGSRGRRRRKSVDSMGPPMQSRVQRRRRKSVDSTVSNSESRSMDDYEDSEDDDYGEAKQPSLESLSTVVSSG